MRGLANASENSGVKVGNFWLDVALRLALGFGIGLVIGGSKTVTKYTPYRELSGI